MKVPGIYYGALVVFCAITLCVGMASAADGTSAQDAGNSGQWHAPFMHHAFDLTNATVQQQILTNLQQKGVDTSGLQTAFQNGNTTAAMEWLHRQSGIHAFRMNARHHANATQTVATQTP